MSIITSIISKHGVSVTYRGVTRTYNSRGDETETTSDSTVSCIFQLMSGGENIHDSGRLTVADAQAFFEPTQTITIGDKVQYQSVWYRIVKAIKEQDASTELFWDVELKREITT